PNVIHPDGARRIAEFRSEPWPSWTFCCEEGIEIEQEIVVPKGSALATLCWRTARSAGVELAGAAPASKVRLSVRPFLSGRDYHSLHHENPAFRFDAERDGGPIVFRPYAGIPGIVVLTNG